MSTNRQKNGYAYTLDTNKAIDIEMDMELEFHEKVKILNLY